MLEVQQHVGSRKTYNVAIAADDGARHPISGKPEWRIVAHRCLNGEVAARHIASLSPAIDGLSAEVQAFEWPGIIEIEIVAHAPHPGSADPQATPRTTRFTERLVITVPVVPEIAETLALRITS